MQKKPSKCHKNEENLLKMRNLQFPPQIDARVSQRPAEKGWKKIPNFSNFFCHFLTSVIMEKMFCNHFFRTEF